MTADHFSRSDTSILSDTQLYFHITHNSSCACQRRVHRSRQVDQADPDCSFFVMTGFLSRRDFCEDNHDKKCTAQMCITPLALTHGTNSIGCSDSDPGP